MHARIFAGLVAAAFSIASPFASDAALAAPAPAVDQPEELTMAVAIAKANRNNPTLYARRLEQELNELTYEAAFRRMWLPSVSLTLSHRHDHTIGQLPGSPESGNRGSMSHGTPLSAVSLNLGEYTIYNFGRDHDTYRQAELSVERSRQELTEVERAVRFQVITAVFNFKTRLDLLEAAQRSVEAAESVYELVKSRIPLGRASHADLASTEIDLLNAKNILIQNQTAYSSALWELNLVLGDPIGHRYKTRTEIKYIKFRMPLDEVTQIFQNNAPAIKEARKNLEVSRAALRLAEKSALPLPTIKFTGLQLGYQFGPAGTQRDFTGASTGYPIGAATSGNLNVSAGVLLTIPLVGDNGFLFGRTLRAAEVQVEAADVALRNAANSNEVQVRTLYTQMVQLENSIDNNQRIFKQANQVFESSLGLLQSRATFSRLDIKNALEQLRTAELELTSSILTHYSVKLQLANLIGVDRFPEENL